MKARQEREQGRLNLTQQRLEAGATGVALGPLVNMAVEDEKESLEVGSHWPVMEDNLQGRVACCSSMAQGEDRQHNLVLGQSPLLHRFQESVRFAKWAKLSTFSSREMNQLCQRLFPSTPR